MRIVFAGSPSFIFPVLKFLVVKQDLVAILTNAPAKTGRGKKIKPSPFMQSVQSFLQEAKTEKSTPEILQAAKKLSTVKIFEIETLDANLEDEMRKLDCDLLVCYAFGKIFSGSFLSCFRYGGINIHPSLLPRWRGATPVPAAILHGDKITGVSIQTIAKKMDSGNILAFTEYELNDTENAGEVLETLTEKSLNLLDKIFEDFSQSLKNAKPQDESLTTYCTKIQREKINWDKSAIQIMRTVLALTPNPRAFSTIADERITLTKVSALEKNLVSGKYKHLIEKKFKNGKILQSDKKHGILVQTGDGILAIQNLQRQGKKEMAWRDFLNGYKGFLELSFDN